MEEKHWYLSKTIWGALIAMLATVLQFAGVHLGVGDQGAITDSVIAIAGAAGSLTAVYGRLTATSGIKKT